MARRRVAPPASLGSIAAFGLTRLMAAVLFGVGPLDPLTFIVAALLLALVAWAAGAADGRHPFL
jgi:hypothetical protein